MTLHHHNLNRLRLTPEGVPWQGAQATFKASRHNCGRDAVLPIGPSYASVAADTGADLPVAARMAADGAVTGRDPERGHKRRASIGEGSTAVPPRWPPFCGFKGASRE